MQKVALKTILPILAKCRKIKTKMVPFEKSAKIMKQIRYHSRNSVKKMVPLEKSTKNHKQKWYHFRKVPKFSNKNGTNRVV